MGIQAFPATTGGGIKSVQRGSAGAAGTVTIIAVDVTKSFVNIFGTASSGAPALSGTVSGPSANVGAANGTASAQSGSNASATMTTGNNNPQLGNIYSGGTPASATGGWRLNGYNFNLNAQNIAVNAVNAAFNASSISAGSTNLITAVVQGYLSSSTSLVVSGPCRWEVVEFS